MLTEKLIKRNKIYITIIRKAATLHHQKLNQISTDCLLSQNLGAAGTS